MKPLSIGNFCICIACDVAHPKACIFPKGACRLCSVFSDFDSPHPKLPVPTCGPPTCLVG